MITYIILLLLLCMIIALAIALFQLLKTPSQENTSSDKLFKALAWRIGIWVVLFVFIVLAVKLDWIQASNSVHPKRFNEIQQQRIDAAENEKITQE